MSEQDRRDGIDLAVESFRTALEQAGAGWASVTVRESRAVGRAAADFVLRDLPRQDSSRPSVAARIGPIYTLDDLSAWIEGGPVTPEAMRQRAERRSIVAFRTADHRWAVPAWQFRPADGRLHLLDGVVALWRSLPHDTTFLTDADLAAWMATPMRTLDGMSPAEWAATHDVDDRLAIATSRLAARAA